MIATPLLPLRGVKFNEELSQRLATTCWGGFVFGVTLSHSEPVEERALIVILNKVKNEP